MAEIYCDGAGWNGTKSEYCILKEGQQPIRKTYNTKMTNNEMEYLAIINALTIAQKGDTIITDSQLVEMQIKRKYAVKAPNLKNLHKTAQELYTTKEINIQWKRREENKAGKILEKK